MLYIKRRNQLFRDLSRTELNAFRRRYIKLRYNILSQKYNSSQSAGDSCQQQLSVDLHHVTMSSSDITILTLSLILLETPAKRQVE